MSGELVDVGNWTLRVGGHGDSMTVWAGWWQVNGACDSVGAMSQTVIGPQTRIAGALSGADDLIVEGIVEGPINGDGAVVIKTGARVGGPVRGRDVTIAG